MVGTSAKWWRCQWGGSSEKAVLLMVGAESAGRTEGEGVDVVTDAEGRRAADEGDDVEAKGDVAELISTNVGDGSERKTLLFVAIYGGCGIFPTVVAARFHFNENEFAPIVGDEVNFQRMAAPVAFQYVVVALEQVLAGGGFTDFSQFVV